MTSRSFGFHRPSAILLVALVGVGTASCEAEPAAPETPAAQAAAPVMAAIDPIERGRYLTVIGGCGDCHTPGYFFGMPDHARSLAGGDVGFFMPGLGYVVPSNLTPDIGTGLGAWTEDEIVTAIRTGVRPDGRVLAPIMPWAGLSNLTDEDAYAIAAYLKSMAPVSNAVPPPTSADQPAPGPYMTIQFPEGMAPPGPPAP